MMTASPVFPVDPNQDPLVNVMPCVLTVPGTPSSRLSTVTVGNLAGTVVFSGTFLGVVSPQYVYSPPGGGISAVRTPTNYGWATCTTVADTVVYTPSAGKKPRILKIVISPDAGLAAAGLETIQITDNGADIAGLKVQTYLPIAASVAHQVPIVLDLTPNGYLCAAANNTVGVKLGTAATAGGISVTFIGTEE